MITISLANNSVAQFFTVTAIFAFVLAVTYFTTRWIGNYQKKQISHGNIKVVESLRISNNKVLEIVNVGSKYYLIAVCKDTVTQIGEIDGTELENEKPAGKDDSFGNVFSRFKVVHKDELESTEVDASNESVDEEVENEK